MIKHYDLKQDHPKWVNDIFLSELDLISKSDYQLKYNYTLKELKLDKMLSLNVIVDEVENDLICFSGVQINSWPYNIARLSSRHYFNKKYASTYLRKRVNWTMCVTEQIKTAIDNGIEQMFFSTELMSEKMFILQCKNSTKAINTILPNVKLIPLDGLYDTTGKRKHWQKIGQLVLNDNPWLFPLERKG